ncbi:MAG: hypothetical protein HQ534_01020 [Armatimonadetes bacterium]|nr:hypothetical protein [Armatimonadota bacterium]
MNKKILSILIVMIIFISMAAQEIRNDIIAVNYEKKNARKAMLFSAIFPGAGQFYANRNSITTYIFPVIEIGLWYGLMHFTKEGQDLEKDFEKFADDHYSRTYQHDAEDDLIIAPLNNSTFYDNHFRLDDANTQHFYEDIGKYDKYIFGWLDWTSIYATHPDGYWTGPDWIWEEDELGNRWEGNHPTDSLSSYYVGNEELYDGKLGRYSGMRAEYISMRNDSRDSYETADLFGFGIVLNHIVSAFDALRVTQKYNREYISDNSLKIKLMPVMVQNNIAPALVISKRF